MTSNNGIDSGLLKMNSKPRKRTPKVVKDHGIEHEKRSNEGAKHSQLSEQYFQFQPLRHCKIVAQTSI